MCIYEIGFARLFCKKSGASAWQINSSDKASSVSE
jgi:hypothetical protein